MGSLLTSLQIRSSSMLPTTFNVHGDLKYALRPHITSAFSAEDLVCSQWPIVNIPPFAIVYLEATPVSRYCTDCRQWNRCRVTQEAEALSVGGTNATIFPKHPLNICIKPIGCSRAGGGKHRVLRCCTANTPSGKLCVGSRYTRKPLLFFVCRYANYEVLEHTNSGVFSNREYNPDF